MTIAEQARKVAENWEPPTKEQCRLLTRLALDHRAKKTQQQRLAA